MIIGVFKSTRMEWQGHVARMAKKRNMYMVLVKKKTEGK